MNFQIQSVKTSYQIVELVALAKSIWNQHFVDIIGQKQVDYMLDKFQSHSVIEEQIAVGYEYYMAFESGRPVGYIGLVPNDPAGKLMLSKLYVESNCRGSGIGFQLLEFTKNRAIKNGATAVWLTVNRDNLKTIDWYKKRGFILKDEVKMDIGNGFFMDDYVFELRVG